MDSIKQFKRVGTHSGRFHADEVMATAILKAIYDLEVVRTRDMDILSNLELIYDIGNGEFDHHQIEKEYRENGTPYAACGLIWRKFGKEAIKALQSTLNEEEAEDIFLYTDAFLVESIDASDNGLRTTETIIPTMCISSIIGGFNPQWDAAVSEDTAFHEAVSIAEAILKNTIDQKASAIRAKIHIAEAYKNRVRPELLILDRSYPWERTLRDTDTQNEVQFVIYPRDGDYLIQTVRESGGARRDRKSLPEAWAGKREEELGRLIGIEDAVFCHTARFIAGARSFESIMKMAELAISEPVEEAEDIAAPAVSGLLHKIGRLLRKRIVIRVK